jgi:hypothetical protein
MARDASSRGVAPDSIARVAGERQCIMALRGTQGAVG